MKNKGTPIAYTTKDVQLISNEVMKAPLENVVVEKVGVSTRSKERKQMKLLKKKLRKKKLLKMRQPRQSRSRSRPPRQRPSRSPVAAGDPPIGQSIGGKFESHAGRELRVKGGNILRQKRKKNDTATWWYQIKWGKSPSE